MRHLTRLLPVFLLPLGASPTPAQGQVPAPAGYTLMVDVSDRWMHGRQRPAFTEHQEYGELIRIDSVRAGALPGARTLHLRLSDWAGRWSRGFVAHDGAGRPVRVEARLGPWDSGIVGDSTYLVHGRLTQEETVWLPQSRIWEMVPSFPAGSARPRASWTDSLDLRAGERGFSQSLAGRRVSTIVKDTLVGGRRLWIVRDSARVVYAERAPREERTLDTLVFVERTAAGVVRGRHLYDPALRLFRVRHDTTVLAGQAVLRYPDGRAFTTPARYDRVRHWLLADSAAIAAIRRARVDDEDEGPIGHPRGPLEERIASGDRAARDSAMAAWHRSRDPEERARLLRALEWSREEGPGPRTWSRLSLEAGDTAAVLEEILGRFHATRRRPLDLADLGFVLPLMDDPGLAFAFGMDRDPFYENARQSLTTHPPAITPDPLWWMCTRAACELLARQRTAAREPRLRAVGLIASLVLDPRPWADSVLAWGAHPPFMQDAVWLVRGVAATSNVGSKAPLPGPAAGWRAWLEWMEGQDPTFSYPGVTGWHVVFDERHATAIRFHRALTGRDVAAEVRAKLAAAAEDSARLVYGAILLGVGERLHTPEAVRDRLTTGSPAERALALREVPGLFTPPVQADSAVAAEVLNRLLAAVIEDAEAWPYLFGSTRRGFRGVPRVAESNRVYVQGDGVPASVRARWERGGREPALNVVLLPVLQAGPFLRLVVSYYARSAGGMTIYLVRVEGGWQVVELSEWET